jgi:hypothetical protein
MFHDLPIFPTCTIRPIHLILLGLVTLYILGKINSVASNYGIASILSMKLHTYSPQPFVL